MTLTMPSVPEPKPPCASGRGSPSRPSSASAAQNFASYEPPENPAIRIDTTAMTPEQAADFIVDTLLP